MNLRFPRSKTSNQGPLSDIMDGPDLRSREQQMVVKYSVEMSTGNSETSDFRSIIFEIVS